MAHVTCAFEGSTDEPIARRLVKHVGASVTATYGVGGKAKLDAKLSAYNNAARHSAWFVLRDFDHDANCPGQLVGLLIAAPSQFMCLRLAVRATEAWLLADYRGISEFLSVRASQVPADPETLTNPKEALINLARKSKKNAIKSDMVPKAGAVRPVGPGYTARVIEFALGRWDPVRAAANAPSLRKCIEAIALLATGAPY